jgi:pyrimidine-nucleoside phosphorylase
MLALGEHFGRRVVCEITAMDEPLGQAVGNAVEVREAVAMLRGEGPRDLAELVLRSAAQLLVLSDLGVSELEARLRVEQAVSSGSALRTYRRWVEAQGGDPEESSLPQAPVVRQVAAPADGYVTRLSALGIGRAAAHLGAGRLRKDDRVDHATGVLCLTKRGARVTRGEALAEVHARDDAAAAAAAAEVASCYTIGADPPDSAPLVLDVLC